jgi:hypothetical protein
VALSKIQGVEVDRQEVLNYLQVAISFYPYQKSYFFVAVKTNRTVLFSVYVPAEDRDIDTFDRACSIRMTLVTHIHTFLA